MQVLNIIELIRFIKVILILSDLSIITNNEVINMSKVTFQDNGYIDLIKIELLESLGYSSSYNTLVSIDGQNYLVGRSVGDFVPLTAIDYK